MKMIKVLTIEGRDSRGGRGEWDFEIPANVILGIVSLLGTLGGVPPASMEESLDLLFKDQKKGS